MSQAATEKQGLSRYFSREAVVLALILAILPNLFFLLVMPFFIAHRLLAPVLYLGVGLISLTLPKWVSYGLFLGVAAFDVLTIMMLAFNLPLDVTLQSAQHLDTLNTGGSLFYIVFVSLIAVVALACAFLLGKNRKALKPASPVLAALLTFAVMGVNYKVNQPHLTKYEGPADGALLQTGLDANTIAARGNNLLIVMVEGMGAYADPADRAILQEMLNPLEQSGRFDMSAGTSYYHGSTTGAASRELCGKWGDYVDYMEQPQYNCLPRQLAERGFETVAIHGFDISMFRRDLWYPRIGFTELNFKDDLLAQYDGQLSEQCGSVFDGLCDTELGPVVAAKLKAGDAPKMVYWLTLNSHIPFTPKPDEPLACRSADAAIDNEQVCQLTELWGDVFESVSTLASDPDLPPTDILIAGDHHTPLWARKAKNKFIPNKVDWYLLKDTRSDGGQPAQLALQP